MVSIIFFVFGFYFLVYTAHEIISLLKDGNHRNDNLNSEIEPFSLPAYFDRMEQASLDILEKQEPIDQTIILWWGLDGLRLNEDGTIEWISRKRQKPVNQDTSYQMCQSIAPFPIFDMSQSTQATQEQILSLKLQKDMESFNVALQHQMQGLDSALQSHVVPMQRYIGYLPYMQPTYLQSVLASPLTQCCCNLYH